ncbi:MAG: glycosyltransferase family 2 protein [Candidatus Gracilibacteria bacterium]|nr:glycosyltransferase family 2 protein [Candidatus Gracilibacteria bacterium]
MARSLVVMPVYNESEVFEEVLKKTLFSCKRFGLDLVVVDDGSARLLSTFSAASQKPIVLLRHEVNCGVGAAVGTGFAYAKREGYQRVLTIDGDGQHDPADLEKLIEKLDQGNDVVNGSRFLSSQKVPASRRVANFFGNIVTFFLSGLWVSDSQSGMKGFSVRALDQLEIFSAGYEWCTDVFREASWYDLKVVEVPISVKYTEYSMKKGQSFAVGTDMVMRLVIRALMR